MTISRYDDVIDSRDVIERIEELESVRDAAEEAASVEGHSFGAEPFGADEREELAALEKLAEEASGYAPDWQHGATLIRDSYFEEYARELAEELCLVDENTVWPHSCIDWKQATRELQMDYTAVDFDGVTYWIR